MNNYKKVNNNYFWNLSSYKLIAVLKRQNEILNITPTIKVPINAA